MKKLLRIAFLVAVFACIFALCVSASYIYKNEQGETMFTFETATAVTNNSHEVIKTFQGEFPKTDEQGNALTWYVTNTETVGGNTVKTVASVKTLDSDYFTLSKDGKYSYGGTKGKIVTQYNVVSVNFPYDSGISTLSLENDGYKISGYSYSPFSTEILFLYLPNTLTILPERIVQNSKVLVCDIPSDAPFTSISRVAFYHAKCLREVNIPSSVQKIYSVDANEGTTFYQCESLKRVTFGENSVLTEIQAYAFLGCASLSDITLPDSLLKIGNSAFYAVPLVNSPFTANSKCQSIGSSCFENIDTLKNMIIPNGIVELDVNYFMKGCDALESIEFGNNPQTKKIKEKCFEGYSKIKIGQIPDSVLEIQDKAFAYSGIEYPFSPDSQCTKIGHMAFAGCSKIKVLNIPKNAIFVTDLSSYPGGDQKNGVFASCTALEQVNFPDDYTGTVLPAYMFAYCSKIEVLKIPNGVTTLSPRLVDRCTSLETLILGAGVTSINNGRAYSDGHNSLTYGCTSLKYVYLSVNLDMSVGHTDACHVFSTADYKGTFEPLTVFINGDYDEAVRIQNGFKNVSSCNKNDRINNATIISLEEYNKLSEVTKNYVVFGVNTCDAFYNGIHNEDGNPCVINCAQCNTYGEMEKNPEHNLEREIAYENGYATQGVITSRCLNEGCECNKPTQSAANAIFSVFGYSTRIEKDGIIGLTFGYEINIEAVSLYNEISAAPLEYGVAAVFKSNLGQNQPKDCPKAAFAYINSCDVYTVDIIIRGSSAQWEQAFPGTEAKIADSELYMVGFVNDGTYKYFCSDEISADVNDLNAITYNQVEALK